jgi:Zn finger protein HypA/HybF involved in hydrogenase expression
VSLSLVKAPKSSYLDVDAALYAICSTGKGRCWHCDRKLPPAEEAIDAGWHVQCVEGERVASIILVCPKCRRKRAKVGKEEFLCNLSPPVCNPAQ